MLQRGEQCAASREHRRARRAAACSAPASQIATDVQSGDSVTATARAEDFARSAAWREFSRAGGNRFLFLWHRRKATTTWLETEPSLANEGAEAGKRAAGCWTSPPF